MRLKQIDEQPSAPVGLDGARSVSLRMMIGPEDGANRFHMRHFTVEPKGHTPRHRHDYEHEVLILRGTATVVSEDGEHSAGPRTTVFVPANEEHQFRNEGDDPLEFICLIPAPESCS